ncbi:aminotransferase class III-fold pyridoxal phosphate-dependent enzyme [Streptomyces sp. NPDC058294]|uniref:aminotransferase class III-fold pyridoxal phosphate-dependent enzyme n=1 Tax=Streptomyces sp. NPDC058294 TaxID=3346430 RepID=UPI0036E65A09
MLPVVSHAAGVYVFDETGKEYLDGCSGAVNVNLGHGVEGITKRMHDQIDKVCFAYRTQFRSRSLEQLTDQLKQLAPGEVSEVVYGNSGSEAIETALRLVTLLNARSYRPFKSTVLTEEPSYHGMTAGALAASGHPLRREYLTPLLANQATVAKVRPKNGALRADAEDWEEAIERIGPANLAAVIIEPVGGASSGAVPTDWETLRRLRELADEHRFVLIADEVMSGLGRTGKWFASQHAGIAPDVTVVGKGISSGYAPISATLISRALADQFDVPPSSLLFGHTMAGAPLAAAAGLAVVEYSRDLQVADRAARAGERLRRILEDVTERHPLVTGVRGVGLQLALGVHSTPERFPGTSADLTQAAREEGLLLYPAGIGPRWESVLVTPPLTISDRELDDLAVRLDRALLRLAPQARQTSDRALPATV